MGVSRSFVIKDTMVPQFKVAVEVVVKRQGQCLMCQRPTTDEDAPNTLCFPGGKIEQHEILPDVLEHVAKREVLEETGVHIHNLKYVWSTTTLHGSQPVLFVTFQADFLSGEPTPQPGELDAVLWMTPEQILEDPRTPLWIRETVRRCQP